MSRNAEITFFCWEWDFAVGGATSQSGRLPADAEAEGWFPTFMAYREDEAGRLLYLWQPNSGYLRNLVEDIAWMRAHPRPHFAEVFDRVDIRDERKESALVKTLHNVTLLEALDGLIEALKARDAA